VDDEAMNHDLIAFGLAGRYADAVTHRSARGLRACWATGGRWSAGPPLDFDVSGGDEIERTWRQRMSTLEFIVMTVRSVVAEAVAEERIEARTVLSEFGRKSDGSGVDMYGSYTDVVIREDGRWVYLSRSLDVIYRDTPTLSGAVYTPWSGLDL
jgi:hypothetical protein